MALQSARIVFKRKKGISLATDNRDLVRLDLQNLIEELDRFSKLAVAK